MSPQHGAGTLDSGASGGGGGGGGRGRGSRCHDDAWTSFIGKTTHFVANSVCQCRPRVHQVEAFGDHGYWGRGVARVFSGAQTGLR